MCQNVYSFLDLAHIIYVNADEMERISHLILKKFKGTITPEESDELCEWMNQSTRRKLFVERLLDSHSLDNEYRSERLVNTMRPYEEMQRRISQMKNGRVRKAILAAAAIIIVCALTFWISRYKSGISLDVKREIAENRLLSIDEIKPGSVGAVCINSQGQAVELGATDTSCLANRFIINQSPSDKTATPNLCLEVARGREFKIVLEDSTVVWLNSESTLSYPESFGTGSRTVAVTGEAYFEIKHDKRPFYVEAGGQQIKVYGTAFNVRGYEDEDEILTTLESGKISITRRGNNEAELILTPGHQSRYNKNSTAVTVRAVDSEVVTGWRHGKFVFEETPLEIIMRDLSRWYDFEYEFKDPSLKDIIFMGSVSRYSDFKTVIRILEDGGEVKFSVTDNKIIISKKEPN